ncbi:MAG: SH3 domain-containing protein [Lachnospiraceae bacterium]|nr:SH3 domain-containing protein [Lachnospiraceae bacterium]
MIRKVISLMVAMSLAFPTISSANVRSLPEVSEEMLSYEHWLKDSSDSDRVLAEADEIKRLNESFLHCTDCNMNDLAAAEGTYNGKSANLARWKSAMSSLSAYLDGNHYDRSDDAVSGPYVMEILNNIEDPDASTLEEIRFGIAVHRSDVRAYPTDLIIADDPGDSDFDNVQNSAVRVGEPVTVYASSSDGKYYYCNTSCVSGWIPSEDIALCHDKDEWLSAWQIPDRKVMVVTDSKFTLEASNTDPELSGLMLTMGTVLEKVEPYEFGNMIGNRSSYYNYTVWIPVRDENGMFARKQALVSVHHGLNDGYLPLTTANILKQAYAKLGDTYGWGGMLSSVDCSSYVRDVYKCFGLELPRNTTWQAAMPVERYDITEADDDEKKALLDTLSPGAILFFKGHEMLYLGHEEDRYYVISATSSMMYPGTNDKARVRSVIINTLDVKRANGNTWLSDLYEAAVPYVPATSEDADIITTGGSPWIDSDIKENITSDMPTDPADDFHLYVNRDWICKSKIPEGTPYYYGAFDKANEETQKKLLEMINDDSLSGNDAKLVRAFYDIAIDWDRRNDEGLSPLRQTVNDIQAIKSLDDATALLCDQDRSFCIPTLFDVANTQSLSDSSRYVADVTEPSLFLGAPEEYTDRTEQGDRAYEAYKEEMVTLLMRLLYSKEEALEIYDDAIAFETKLAGHMYTSVEQMSPDFFDKCNNVYTKEEFAALCPDIPVMNMISANGYGDAKEYLVENPGYFRALNDIYTEDNLKLVKAYMLTGYVDSAAYMADRAAYETTGNRTQAIYGISGFMPYEKLALKNTRNALPEAVSRAYLEKYDSIAMKEDITKLCEKIIKEYRTMLESEDWMSEETRKKAIEKLDALTVCAVYPDKWMYDYEGIDLAGMNYYEACKTVARYKRSVNAGLTDQTVDEELWPISDILQANACYESQENKIMIIRGILEGDFYHENMSEEELMGGIGYVIGHEISHAFDTNGSQFDKDGNFRDWWQKEDYAAFRQRTDKLVSYFNNITIWDGLNVPGNNIQTEAIADMGSVKVLLSMAGSVDGFDYDAFFKKLATVYRTVITPEYEMDSAMHDVHPLSYLRTNAVLQQFDEFYETYDVKEGDNMYLAPSDRISIW